MAATLSGTCRHTHGISPKPPGVNHLLRSDRATGFSASQALGCFRCSLFLSVFF
jgi:hypothetical protein